MTHKEDVVEDPGKRMSEPQQIGKRGEDYFRYWATSHHINATRPDFDMGIDFLCQVLAPVSGSKSLEGVGSMFGAQIKTVQSGGPSSRIVLDRKDATDLLRQTQATCIFGVQLDSETVFFKFLDEDLMDRLQDFLKSDNAQWTMTYSNMSSDLSLFEKELLRKVHPNFQSRLRIRRANQRLVEAIPGSEFSLSTSSDYVAARVVVPSVSEAYQIEPIAKEEARLQIFERGYVDPSLEGVSLHPAIGRIVEEMQSSLLVLIGATGHTVDVRVRSGAEEAVAEFEVRTFGDEVSLVHSAGLRLTYSAARKDEQGYVHHLEHNLFSPEPAFKWDENGLRFFSLLQPGAELIMPNGRTFGLSMFGGSIEHLGSAVQACYRICEALELPANYALADLKTEEFAYALTYLNAFLFDDVTTDRMVPAFVFGPAANLPVNKLKTKRMNIRLPIAVNWKETGILIRVEAETQAFKYRKKFCGFRITKQRDWTIAKHERFDKSPYPEAWFYPDWPAIQLRPTTAGKYDFTYDGARLPFGAEVWLDE